MNHFGTSEYFAFDTVLIKLTFANAATAGAVVYKNDINNNAHPAEILGIFDKRMNKEGALSGMIVGVVFTTIYIFYFKPQLGGPGLPQNYLFGISPEGIGTIGMIINFIVSLIVSRLTKPTPENIKELVESIRYPK